MIRWLEENKLISWVITSFIFIFIFYISSLSFALPPKGPVSINATFYHIGIFFILSVFFFISSLDRKWNSKKIILSLAILVIYALLDELHQFFVPGRFMSFDDFLLDFAGIQLASLIYYILIFKKRL